MKPLLNFMDPFETPVEFSRTVLKPLFQAAAGAASRPCPVAEALAANEKSLESVSPPPPETKKKRPRKAKAVGAVREPRL